MDPWLTWISDVGFPVAVTFYLLMRMEQKLDKIIFTLQHQQSVPNSLDVMQKRQIK
ncbi:YvrJ family protein [Bacillus alkalisoli]|uniref:YvrJ family protein n=1 Tax=Bacillus alkalisoli TaxID=2011008 RepID=UPI000C24CB96|nr:YvrJ family protein [Bacillus alkalisoli]